MTLKKQLQTIKQDGFSLVELLVVIAIIAILSVVAYTSFSGSTDKAKDSKSLSNLDAVATALEIYRTNEGAYPDELKTGPVENGLIPKEYLSKIPTDPGKAKHPYLYAKSGSTFQVAGVLRKDGDVANFETYVVGNGTDLLLTADGIGFYNNAGVLTACDPGVVIKEGKIATDKNATDGSCVPYDPTI